MALGSSEDLSVYNDILLARLLTSSRSKFSCSTIFLLTLNAVYIETPVVGYSMLPTYNMSAPSDDEYGDVVYINKIRKLERNTIIVAEVNWHPDPIIKRLVGLPGDKIEIKEQKNNSNPFEGLDDVVEIGSNFLD